MGYIYTKSGKLAKRLYFGAVLLFEGLYYTFKNRVLADGGTFVENELPTISQDASLVLTPNAYKAGKLYSAVPNDGTGDFTVDRNSTATYIGQDGLIKTALANEVRIDWSTGEAALLVEPQRTNLIPYSEDFSNTIWNLGRVSIVPDTSITLDGLNTFTKLESDDASISLDHRIRIVNELDVSIEYTAYIYVKYEDVKYFYFREGANNIFSIIDIETNTITKNAAGHQINLENFNNSILRISVTFTTPSSLVFNGLDFGITSEASDYVCAIPIGKGFYVWGAQLEQASIASSYIPTAGVTETRLADDISVPTPAGVTAITETIDGVEQTPITTIPTTYSLPVGNINKVTML